MPVAFLATFIAMTIVGASTSFLVHALANQPNFFEIVFDDPYATIAYFTETGWETGAFWIPIMLLRIAILSIGALRRKEA